MLDAWYAWKYRHLARKTGRDLVWGEVMPDADAIAADFRERGVEVVPYVVDGEKVAAYRAAAGYHRFARYYDREPPPEKVLEHFMARDLLGLVAGETYVDVAAGDSPVAGIYRELDRVEAMRVDRRFRPGRHGDRWGADVRALPWADGSIDKMALHCSFEHFEGDADIGFVREADRLLAPGGRCCILPLYMNHRFAIQSDPARIPWSGIAWDAGAEVRLVRRGGQRHSRFYDVDALLGRLWPQLRRTRIRIYRVVDFERWSPTCYIRFAALIECPEQTS